MEYPPLILGRLIKRYKRFMADIQLKDGTVVTAHCVNTGSMKGCLEDNAPVGISTSENPNRKLKYTLEIIKISGTWVGVNTSLTNRLAEEFIREKGIPELSTFTKINKEVKYGTNSRIDLLLETNSKSCFVEIKNVSMVFDGLANFPDAISTRGTKHLLELMEVVKAGHRGIMLFICQRDDAKTFAPAKQIDPIYAKTLQMAYNSGVEILVYKSKVTVKENKVYCKIPWSLT